MGGGACTRNELWCSDWMDGIHLTWSGKEAVESLGKRRNLPKKKKKGLTVPLCHIYITLPQNWTLWNLCHPPCQPPVDWVGQLVLTLHFVPQLVNFATALFRFAPNWLWALHQMGGEMNQNDLGNASSLLGLPLHQRTSAVQLLTDFCWWPHSCSLIWCFKQTLAKDSQ